MNEDMASQAEPDRAAGPRPQPASPFSQSSIPDAVIEQFCSELQEPLERITKKFCDDAYDVILSDVQEYLRENAVFNIRSKFDAQQRETVTAYKALFAVEQSGTLQEARDNAYAARKGYWTAERAAEYRAQAIEARRAATTGAACESAVAEGDAP